MPKFEVKFHTLIETRVLVEAKNEEQAGFAVEDGEGIILRIPQQLFVEIKNIKQREPDNGWGAWRSRNRKRGVVVR